MTKTRPRTKELSLSAVSSAKLPCTKWNQMDEIIKKHHPSKHSHRIELSSGLMDGNT